MRSCRINSLFLNNHDHSRRYDANGKLGDLWSASSKEKYDSATKCFVDYYNTDEVVPELPSDITNYGNRTKQENVADYSGVMHAYNAWKNYTTTVQEDSLLPEIKDLNSDKLFFVAHAQLWCTKYRPDTRELMVSLVFHPLESSV